MTETLDVITYDITDVAIEDMKREFSGLSAEDAAGYKEVTRAIAKVRNYRTSIENRRKELKRHSLEYGKLVDDKAKEITLNLQRVEMPLKQIKAVVDDEKARIKAEKDEAERKRVKTHQEKIFNIRNAPIVAAKRETLAEQETDLLSLKQLVIDDSYEEFMEVATDSRAEAIRSVSTIIADRIEKQAAKKKMEEEHQKIAAQKAENEKQRLELAAQRAEQKAKQLEIAKEQERLVREEKAALAAAEQARLDAEKKELDLKIAAEKEIVEAKQKELEQAQQKTVKPPPAPEPISEPTGGSFQSHTGVPLAPELVIDYQELWLWVKAEISIRVAKGADSNGHLEGLYDLMQLKETGQKNAA